MSDRYPNREAVAAKILWEGGLQDALEYGVKADQMPPGDDELAAAWRDLEAAYRAMEPLADRVDGLLDDAYNGVEPGHEAILVA